MNVNVISDNLRKPIRIRMQQYYHFTTFCMDCIQLFIYNLQI